MADTRITVEIDGKTEVFECDEFWLFVLKDNGEDSQLIHKYKASPLFRGYVLNHIILNNLIQYLDQSKKSQRK